MLTSSRGPKPPSLRLRRIYALSWTCVALAQWGLFATTHQDRSTFLAGALILTAGALGSIVRARRGLADARSS